MDSGQGRVRQVLQSRSSEARDSLLSIEYFTLAGVFATKRKILQGRETYSRTSYVPAGRDSQPSGRYQSATFACSSQRTARTAQVCSCARRTLCGEGATPEQSERVGAER